MKARGIFILTDVVVLALVAIIYQSWPPILWSLIVIGPLTILGFYDIFQKKHAIRSNFPVLGNLRYVFELIRPEIMQYFVETDTQGRPFDRLQRTMIYERAKRENDTTPFGTQFDVYEVGYEWLNHSIYIKHTHPNTEYPRVLVGGPQCTLPYSASILNISAMSFGSLSKNAVMAMNKGAKQGGFCQNTGEGGISKYHLDHGGDLVWQIGTGYFGCRTDDGQFSPEGFEKNAAAASVKMIEIKISQGAKPGHGGILPASKNTPEIAAIRHVKPHTTVASPPSHSAFSDAKGLTHFIQQLRELSGGKPVGFKLCIGNKAEFIDICKAIVSTGIKPDFITVDGGEGGTGAAPVEFSNSIGMPLRDGLAFVVDTLNGFDLKKDIKVIASGKITSGFHMARMFALGADLCNSARAMMMAVGCIQALECNSNTCPTGVATQNESLMRGLNVPDKADRVAAFHDKTVIAFSELLHATGLSSPHELNRHHINRRTDMDLVKTYEEIYPSVEVGSLLKSLKVEMAGQNLDSRMN